ncbi:hypothetical protein [Blastococcus sp. SYSU D00820]
MPYVLGLRAEGGAAAGRGPADGLRRLALVPAAPEDAPDRDEATAVLDDPAAVVDAVLALIRDGGWVIGVGAGALGDGAAPDGAARGGPAPALLAARRAVDAARRRTPRLAVRGAVPAEAADAQAVLGALATLVARRSEPAWAAIALVADGRTQSAAAAELGITRQAVGQRLAAAGWELERELRPTAARLLARAGG